MTSRSADDADLDLLARAARNGDGAAVTRLLTVLQPRVIRYCRARVGRHRSTYASADDVAQETLLAVFTALPSFQDRGQGIGAFVFRIAANKVADFHRRHGRELTNPVPDLPDIVDDRVGPEHAVLRREQQREVRKLLSNLNEVQREILIHRVVLGRSSEETAELVASSPAAVRVAQHRALAKLRRLLADER